MVPVYYTTLLDNRDFLFEPTTSTLVASLFTYLVDDSFYLVIARNNTNKPIILPKYLRLGTISEINYDNYYLTIAEEVDFTILDLAF